MNDVEMADACPDTTLRLFPLPPLAVAHVGRFLDYDSRRSCALAHRGLRHVMEGYDAASWAVRPGCEFGVKARALLAYKPAVSCLTLTVDAASAPLTEAQAAELGAFLGRLGTPSECSARVNAASGSDGAALSSVLRCVLASARRSAKLVCTVPSFSHALLVLDEALEALEALEVVVNGCAVLAGDDAARAARLLAGWQQTAAPGARRRLAGIYFTPDGDELGSIDDRENLMSAYLQETVRSLLGAAFRVLSVRLVRFPTLLSGIAHRVCVCGHLCGDALSRQLVQHLAGNAALTHLSICSLDPHDLIRLPQLADALREGVLLTLYHDATRDPALGGFVAAVLGTTRAAVELRVDGPDFAQAVAARRALDLVRRACPAGTAARLTCTFSGEAAALGHDRMTLPQLEAALARSAPPWQRLLFGIAPPPDKPTTT
jgi:hypothetical protein